MLSCGMTMEQLSPPTHPRSAFSRHSAKASAKTPRKPSRINTSEKSRFNSTGINTSGAKELKSNHFNTSEKHPGGRGVHRLPRIDFLNERSL